jgi:hypothetical protein
MSNEYLNGRNFRVQENRWSRALKERLNSNRKDIDSYYIEDIKLHGDMLGWLECE